MDAITRAQETAWTRDALGALARGLADEDVGALFDRALESGRLDAAERIAVAARLSERPLAAERLAPVLVEVEDSERFTCLVAATATPRVRALLDLAASQTCVIDREIDALVLAAKSIEAEPDERGRLIDLLRRDLRIKLDDDNLSLLGAAAVFAKARDVEELLGVDLSVPATQSRLLKFAEPVLRALDKPLAQLLPEHEAKKVIAGFMARRSVEKLGRNDVCHCGSGKKYKKCCMTKDEARAKSLSPVSGLTKEEFEAQAHRHLPAKELDELSPGVLARLPVSELDDEQLGVVFRKMVAFSRIEPARRALEEKVRRGGEAKERDAWRADLTRLAFDVGRTDLALETGASIEDRSALPRRLELRLELGGNRGDRLDEVDRVLGAEPAVELAHALLHTHPALGIYVARGALEEGQAEANKELMWDLDACRDRLRLSPFDPYWDVHDFLAGLSHEVKAERRANKLAQEEKSKLEAQLQALRERMRNYSTKTVALEKELTSRADELEEARKGLERASKAVEAGREAKQASERARDLKLKVDALKAQIAEGNEERRRLRDELAKIEEEREDVEEAAADVEPDAEPEEEETSLSLALLVPHFTDGARADLERMPKRVAADAIRAAGELGAGDPPAWRHAKRLQGLDEVFSARLGIHHRMLFRKKDGRLEVFTIVDREDLDKTIAHLR